MDVPKTIEFSIEGDDYQPQGAPAEKFGSDYAGTFRLRWPTVRDRREIEGRFVASMQALGVIEPTAMQLNAFLFSKALVYFEVLTREAAANGKGATLVKPAWCSEDRETSDKLEAAIIHAFQRAEQFRTDQKKSSAQTGSSSSPPAS